MPSRVVVRIALLVGVWLVGHDPSLITLVGFGAVVMNRRLVLFDFNDLEEVPAVHGVARQPSYSAVIGVPQFIAYNQKIDPNGKRGCAFNDAGGTRTSIPDGRAFAWNDLQGPGPDAAFQLLLNTAGYTNLHIRFDYRGASADSFNIAYSRDGGFSYAPLFYRIRMIPDDTWHSIEIDLSSRLELQNADQIILLFDGFNNSGTFRIDNLEVYGDLLEASLSAPAIDDDRQLPPAVCGIIGDPEFAGYRFPFSVASLGDAALTVSVTIAGERDAVRAASVNKLDDDRWELVIGGVGDTVGIAQLQLTVADSRGNQTSRVVHFGAIQAGVAPSAIRTFFPIGAADASAAAFFGPDQFIVANDEDQLLRVYNIAPPASALPIATSHDTLPEAPTDNGLALQETREVDIEGVFVVGSRYYYTASLSNANDGTPRPNRDRIFCVDYDGTGFRLIGSYHHLLADLIAWDQQDGHGLGVGALRLAAAVDAGVLPTDVGGLNVEGLAAMGDPETGAYLGFRAPLVGGTQALLVPILNFTTLAESRKGGRRGSALFGSPLLLDLGGRGVRSMVCNGRECLILAGPVSDVGGDFALYSWDRHNQPHRHAADLTGLRPEGILGWNGAGGPVVIGATDSLTDHTTVVLVSDLGSVATYYPDLEQKDLPLKGLKYFRVDVVPLGPIMDD